MVKYVYEINFLKKILYDDSAILIGNYDNLNSKTKISYNCKCGNEYKKSFNAIYMSGGYCKDCMNKVRLEKIKKTNLEKYGVENPFQSKEIIKKIKATNKEKYGVESPLQSQEIKNKVKQTCIYKYGVENISQSNIIKDKKNATYIEHYGMHPKKTEEVNEKYKQTCLDRYGVENTAQITEVKEKIKNTFIQNYGGHPMLNETIKQKVKDTCMEKYGGYPAQNEEIKEKARITCIERYGGYPNQNHEIMEKNQKNSKKYKKYTMPSGKVRNVQGFEPYALDELLNLYSEDQIISERKDIPRISYIYKNKQKYYFPDIFIPHENKIIEVKSTWTYELEKDKNIQKFDAAKAKGYLFECWTYDYKGIKVIL